MYVCDKNEHAHAAKLIYVWGLFCTKEFIVIYYIFFVLVLIDDVSLQFKYF